MANAEETKPTHKPKSEKFVCLGFKKGIQDELYTSRHWLFELKEQQAARFLLSA